MTKILVVEDSISMRQMVCATLQGAGYEISEASNGEEAFQLANTQTFDVVVSDVNMPIMDGITLVKNLRNLPNYRFTPLLLLTTESGASKKAEGKAAGATGWLVKPFDPEQLLVTIEKVL